MKKYILTLGLFLFISSFISCSKQLVQNPFNGLSENALFSTPDGFSNATRGIYADFIGKKEDEIRIYYGGNMFSIPDILTDNLILNTNGRQSKKTLYDWLYNSNGSGGLLLYGSAYKVIHDANAIIGHIDNLEDGNFKNNIMGEALTARALAHFDLVRTYAQIPTQSPGAGASLGVAYVTVVDPSAKPARNTVNEVYKNIIADLNKAKGLINVTNNPGRFNKNTVNALLSRVYLYMGQWEDVVNSANAVTGSVATRANFPGIWRDENTDGIVTEFLIRIIDGVAIGTGYSQTSAASGVKSEYVVSYNFYNEFKDSDIRKSAYIQTSDYSGVTYNNVAKYFGKTGQVNNIVNSKIIRMAEVMLNKAEAYSEMGQDAPALAALDAVRSQRYSPFISGQETGTDLKNAIAKERRLELAFEGHRFYDLKRKGLDIARDPNNGDVSDGSGQPPSFTLLPAGDHRFELPIPLDAINANSNLVQNPGY